MSLSPRPNPISRVSSQRLPPPSLFQGPPSRNESSNSVQVGLLPGNQASASAQRPGAQRTWSRISTTSAAGNRSISPFMTRTMLPKETESAEALWQEMQNTLAEVELSAFKGEHVFGEEHSKALEELRIKQLKLAQTWTRHDAEEVDEKTDDTDQPEPQTQKTGTALDKAGTTDSTATYKALEAETEKDLQQARKRRQANDQYFERVNNGVLDVVASLEEVAEAMRAVKRESEDIWSDTASESLNVTTASTTG
ncbi:hypothetical protein UA08_05520 [Talaromyces atroroseus]|uniref:Uncharacterized protein n=1 Tax=Talaromyces atroroseus TaxID=1441469 RepID=A0A225ACV7_TALAT|nr:hypothetical protein UA08_05520 [Talaromyces atroroseus]OKL58962.1 hypothetical protein UA08_05520 [Talaromyces atroroseus]